jgi:hypothetical protein
MRLAALNSALGCAQREVRQVVDHWALSQVADVVELLTLELVSTVLDTLPAVSCYHDISKVRSIELRLRRAGCGLVIAMWDGDPRPPALERYGAERATGSGLRFVPMLAEVWDFFPSNGGKVTWCEIRLPAPDVRTLPRRTRAASNGVPIATITDLALLGRVRDGLHLLDTDARTRGQQP